MIKKYKPYTPSRRHLTVADYSALSDTRREKALTKRIKKNAGRNNQGRISMRHQGGGNKILYREVDFLQNKKNRLVCSIRSYLASFWHKIS